MAKQPDTAALAACRLSPSLSQPCLPNEQAYRDPRRNQGQGVTALSDPPDIEHKFQGLPELSESKGNICVPQEYS